MKIDFFKYEGTGNDFVIIDNRNLKFQKDNNELIQNICVGKLTLSAKCRISYRIFISTSKKHFDMLQNVEVYIPETGSKSRNDSIN